ncbi:hypothetical protein [Amylibacter marinus]|nr:hypothetical protein [Amylibacter marinus]
MVFIATVSMAQADDRLDLLFDFMEEFSEQTQPMLEEFMDDLAPKLEQFQELISDWSLYEAPEVLPNGDIIIRRKSAPLGKEPSPKQKALEI